MEGLPVERLREYLRQLPPAARALLITELERTLLRGEEIPGGDLVLREVRSAVRDSGEHALRIGSPERLFFAAVEPFLVDEMSAEKQQCRIARASLEPIWAWLCRDLIPAEAKAYSAQCQPLAGPGPLGALHAADLGLSGPRDRTYRRGARRGGFERQGAAETCRPTRSSAGVRRSARPCEDTASARCARSAFGDRVPAHVRNLADAALDAAKAALDAPSARQNGILPYALVMLMSRLAAPWQLIRVAVRAVQSDEAARIAATPYAMAVTAVLAEIERMVDELKGELKRGGNVAVTSLLKSIHDAVRGVRTELDLPADQQWGRQLGAIRSEISSVLRTGVESAPGRVRRLVRPRPVKEIMSGSVLDAGEVAEVEALIELVTACRIYASELAISEMTTRAYGELQQILVPEPRCCSTACAVRAAERAFRRSQVDAALRFCGKVFGQEYASLLTKAADVASQTRAQGAGAGLTLANRPWLPHCFGPYSLVTGNISPRFAMSRHLLRHVAVLIAVSLAFCIAQARRS